MFVFLALLFVPGYILVQFLKNYSDLQPTSCLQLLIIYPAVSMGLLSLAYLWATISGLSLTAPVLRIALCIMLFMVLLLAFQTFRLRANKNLFTGFSRQWPEANNVGKKSNHARLRVLMVWVLFRQSLRSILFGICLLGLLGLTIQTRLAHMSQLVAPVWVDSLHHALLIRVTAEHGQVPLNLEPYLPVDGLAYHWGFHSLSAAAISISGGIIPLQLPEAMLWHSFMLQVLVVLTCAGLALALWQRRLAGLIALAIVGLGSIMPAFYLSWGRTTLLTGVMLLPGLMLLSYQLMRHPAWRSALVLAFAMAGLSLTHLPTFVFALAWCLAVGCSTLWLNGNIQPGAGELPAYILAFPFSPKIQAYKQLSETGLSNGSAIQAPGTPRLQKKNMGSLASLASSRPGGLGALQTDSKAHFFQAWVYVQLLFASLMLAGLAQLPWLLLLLKRARPGTGSSALHVAGNTSYNAMPIGLLWAIGNDMLLALAALAALFSILRRRHISALILLWCTLALLLANPVMIGLPYISFVTNEVLVVCLFIPAALLIGGACSIVAEAIEQRWSRARHVEVFFAILTLVWAIWRVPAFQSVVNPDTIITTADDMTAVRWATSGTPADARFLVNTTGWLGPVDRGSDGGWWLLPIAGRQVSTPPVVYTYAPDAIVTQVQADTAWLRAAGKADDVTIAAFMRQHAYSYVFATQHGTTLNSERLRASPLFEEVYANTTVSILRLRQP